MTSLGEYIATVDELTRYATAEVNSELGLPEWKDQSAGNQCHKLTHHVLQALQYRNIAVRRELHRDDQGNWHYVLVRGDEAPSDEDFVSDLNPWQWRKDGSGDGAIHTPRLELMERLRLAEAPEHFVALRSLSTIVKAHEPALNSSGRA